MTVATALARPVSAEPLEIDPTRDRPGFDAAAARRRCLAYRKRILEVSQQVGALHIAPAFSCAEIADLALNHLMRWIAPGESPDMFVLSKGHGCMIQYVVLEEHGALGRDDLDAYCTPDGRLGAHPDIETPGVWASTGSLGHGMGLAVGMAYAERLLGRDGRVLLLLSDGECQEGSTWEAAMMAANLGLDNLIAFVDMNDFSGLERMSDGHPAFHPLADKFAAFGWEAVEAPGHDAPAMMRAVANRAEPKPFVAVCRTVKGRGVSYMEHVPIWHYRSPNAEEFAQAMAELGEIGG